MECGRSARLRSMERVGLALSLLAYAVSWALPAFLFDGHPPLRGIDILLTGWMGVVFLEFGWYANPFFWGACVAVAAGRERLALGLSLVAFALGLTAFTTRGWVFDESELTPIRSLGPGFGMWLSAISGMVAISGWAVWWRRREARALDSQEAGS